MNKFLFMALFFSLLPACCFGPQYRPISVPTVNPMQPVAAAATQSVVLETVYDAATGTVPTAALDAPRFSTLAVRVDVPTTVNRGENMFVGVYPPTGADVEDIVMVVGIANYLNLNRQPDTSFTGYFRVPELFDPGTYTVAFFLRTKNNERRVIQRSLTVQ